MANREDSCAAMEKVQQLIKKPRAECQEEMKQGVEFSGHHKVKAAIERHPAMVIENHIDGFLPCQHDPGKGPQTCCGWKRLGEHRSALAPPPPVTPPAPPGNSEGRECSNIDGVPPRYVDIHTSFLYALLYNLDAYAKDRKRNTDLIPDLLTNERSSTGLYAVSCVVMQLTSILQTKAAFSWNLTAKMIIVKREWIFEYYHCLQLADTFTYILKDILICINKEKCSDRGVSTRTGWNGCHKAVSDILCHSVWLHIVYTSVAE